MDKVISWDRQHPRKYDPRWIALHGMGAFTEESAAFAPEEQWASIDEQTRVEYLRGFDEAMAEFEKLDVDRDGAVTETEKVAFQEKQMAELEKEIQASREFINANAEGDLGP